METIYQIIKMKHFEEMEFVNLIRDKTYELVEKMGVLYAQYDFEKHIFHLIDYLPMIYRYYYKSIIKVDNEDDIPRWVEEFAQKIVETYPTLYATSKFITEKLAERVNASMGTRQGLNTSDYSINMDDIKFGLVSHNTDFITAYGKIIDLAYPAFIIPWLNSLRTLFITTIIDCH